MIINKDCIKQLKSLPDGIFDSCVTDPPYHLASIVKRFGPGQKPINNRDTKMGIDGPYHKIARGFMGQTWDGGDIAFKTEIWKEVFRVLKPGSVLLAFAATRNYHRLAVAIEDSGFEIFDMINWIYGSGFPKRKNLLKPAHEPIVVARKGVNKELNLDECRVPSIDIDNTNQNEKGRYPANVIHDGLEEDWSKYFYCSKASKKEKEDTTHPSVKPINLIRYLIKLVTRKKGTVLDPFAGTGTTGEAAILEGRKYYLIEKNKKYFKDIKNRVGKFNELFI
tara:strand:+ start:1295 stop:2131 length:837 start_codon:yes stop_codon:yes gene_type:complete